MITAPPEAPRRRRSSRRRARLVAAANLSLRSDLEHGLFLQPSLADRAQPVRFRLRFGDAAACGDAPAQNSMQGVPNAMQGFSQNRDKPIQIEAASLEVRDKKKEATFSGNVKVVQGDTTMSSKSLVVFYDQSPAPEPPPQPKQQGECKGRTRKCAPIQSATPGPGGSSSIKRLEARGNVVVTQKGAVVTGEIAVFDTQGQSHHDVGWGDFNSGQERAARRPVDGGHDHRRVAGLDRTMGVCRGLFQSSGQGTPTRSFRGQHLAQRPRLAVPAGSK